MSRHRNFRNYDYGDDMCEDVYGHSVDDADFALSPHTEAQFLYRRSDSHEPTLSAFIEEPYNEDGSEESEEDDALVNSSDYKRPQLDPVSEAKLMSCLDQLRSILGDDCHEETAISAVIENNYDVEQALDQILNKKEKKSAKKSAGRVQKAGPLEAVQEKTDIAERAPYALKPSAADPCVQDTSGMKAPMAGAAVTTPVKVASTKAVTGFVTTEVLPKKNNANVVDFATPMDIDDGSLFEESAMRSKTKSKRIDIAAELKSRQQGKDLINLVVIGHVDAGKSTLMGHVLFKLGHVPKRTMHKYEQESKKVGKASFAYAWVLDETEEERERGVTMDVGLTKFETDCKIVTLMDAPGHRDFIPNMIQGAAQADVAILVINATTGEFEAGFEAGGQTREHALLVRSLGVQQLLVAVNKLDTVKWSQDRYKYITDKLGQFLKQAGFKEADVSFVPCSGLTGENLTEKTTNSDLLSWYKGPCVVEQIDKFKPPERPVDKPFRLCVGDVYKGVGSGISIAGKLEAGSIQNGDKVLVMPSSKSGLLKGLSIHDESVQWACAGDHVALTISGIDINDVNPGFVLCSPSSPIRSCTKLKARIIVFNIEIPITRGFMVLFHYQTLSEPATIKKLNSLLHKSTGAILQKKPRCLLKHSNAEVEIHTNRPVCIELYKDFKDLGRFMLRYGGKTIAAGVVVEIL